MSAILSADDLNDFISPGVACIKPVETLPHSRPEAAESYEVTTEDKLAADNPLPAQVSLTDCLACSGCVTSAEAVLVSMQSHAEVLNALDSSPGYEDGGKIFVASVSPQSRASLAATYGISERKAGHMIEQLLGGPSGLKAGGKHGNGFTWVIDTNVAREACLVLGADEVLDSLGSASSDRTIRPVLTSSCPGWICYAEKTHPHILPYLSRLKSPQALLGTLLKTSLSKTLGIPPSRIWHVAVMPCFDKKLEASRAELIDATWTDHPSAAEATRDVDCVITTREILLLASIRDITLSSLPLRPAIHPPFPDSTLDSFLFPRYPHRPRNPDPSVGTSGGNLLHLLRTFQATHPESQIQTTRGRNADVTEHAVISGDGIVLLKTARYYGFRNIQNLVRRLKPPKPSRMPGARKAGPASKAGQGAVGEYAFVEVMACPGGCTNGGGQVKVEDVANLNTIVGEVPGQKQWLKRVDEAYFSAGSDTENEPNKDDSDPGSASASIISKQRERVKAMLTHWTALTSIPTAKLVQTSYRVVESDVGKSKTTETERVVGLAGKIGGGW
ncbi:MAG: Cytosolic Fe-S cluster assembly factor nar1 [Thelocarpon impressellum]|nr:MAG: Cytosolic Fe-S cluster assembly factor nar1 [Thelocarpon impressellum]